MIDLDRELRALLEEDARHAPPVPDARAAIRRTRRRQVGVVLTALAMVAAIAVGSVAGVSALIRSSERRVLIEPPDTFTLGPLEAVPTGSFDFGDLAVDEDGIVWGTGPGLTRFDPDAGTIRTFTLADDPAFSDVRSIVPARGGGVWIVSPDGPTVRRFDGERFQEVLASGPVCEVAEAPDGTVWGSGCEGGVFRWGGTSWLSTPPDGSTPRGGGVIAVDAGGQVWVANLRYDSEGDEVGFGLSRFDGTAWTTWTVGDGLPSDRVETLATGPSGDVWVGTEKGIARFFDGAWVTYAPAETQVPHDSIAVTDQDVWVAGWTGERGWILRFDGGAWIPMEEGLREVGGHPDIATDGRGSVWASISGQGDEVDGLYRFNGSRWQRVAPSVVPGLLEIAAVSSDEAWGADGDRAWRIRGGTWTSFSGLPGGAAVEVAVAPDGVPWVLTPEGLARFDGSAWEQVVSGDDLAIAFAPDGAVWTASGSIIRPLGGAALPRPIPLPDRVRWLRVGPEGEVWAGCFGFMAIQCEDVLAHFDGQAWETVELPEFEGLIWDIEVTGAGDLWLSAQISPLSEERWTLFVARYREGIWTEFLQTETGERLDTPSADPRGAGELEATPDGELLLADYDGLFVFRDDSWRRIAEYPSAARYHQKLSAAPDGTVWLENEYGLFRLRGV